MLSKVDEALCLIGRWTITSEQCEDATRLMNAGLEQGRAEGAEQANAGKQEAWVIALQEGFHWRFIGVPTHIKEQADRNHDPYSEHVVHILFDGPDPKGEAAQHKMVEAFTKSVDDIMVQAINFRPDKEAFHATQEEIDAAIESEQKKYAGLDDTTEKEMEEMRRTGGPEVKP